MSASLSNSARLIGGNADEIALLGPTSLGLSLFANGIPWQEGDEVLCYQGDYPANVYPWLDLRRRGVVIRYLEPTEPGAITTDLVQQALTPRTRLVALASCHFFTGYRIDVDAIVIADVFQKTTAQTPVHVIEDCRRRLRRYDAASRGD